MKASISLTMLSTMAFLLEPSLASSSPSLEKRSDNTVQFFDEPDIRLRAIQCDNKFFTKPETYAILHHALSSGNGRSWKKWCLPSRKCVTYPMEFDNSKIFFRTSGKYKQFPILANGKKYTGGPPGPYALIFNENKAVAGIVKKGYWSWSKCLFNDKIKESQTSTPQTSPPQTSPPRFPAATRVKDGVSGFFKKSFRKNNPQGTASTESEGEPLLGGQNAKSDAGGSK